MAKLFFKKMKDPFALEYFLIRIDRLPIGRLARSGEGWYFYFSFGESYYNSLRDDSFFVSSDEAKKACRKKFAELLPPKPVVKKVRKMFIPPTSYRGRRCQDI